MQQGIMYLMNDLLFFCEICVISNDVLRIE